MSPRALIVIAAGVAGLSAAKELGTVGFSFVVEEEDSDRIGGRAHSEEIATGVCFDRGCTYSTTSRDPSVVNPFVGIAKDLGFITGEGKKHLFNSPLP